MPYSLRTKLKHLACERDITVKECERLIEALDTVDAVEEIKAEIEDEKEFAYADFDEYNDEILGFDDTDICDRDSCTIGLGRALQIINKHISRKEQE